MIDLTRPGIYKPSVEWVTKINKNNKRTINHKTKAREQNIQVVLFFYSQNGDAIDK